MTISRGTIGCDFSLDKARQILFGPIMLAVFFGVGLYFTVRLKGVQFTRFGTVFREVVLNVGQKSDDGVGQIRGLELSTGERVYVVDKDMARNTVTVGPIRAAVRARYRQAERPATVYPLPQNKARIVFDAQQRAITPGRAAVLYEGDLVLGGRTIEEKQQAEPGC